MHNHLHAHLLRCLQANNLIVLRYMLFLIHMFNCVIVKQNPLPYLARYPRADVLTSSDQVIPTVVDDSLEIWQEGKYHTMKRTYCHYFYRAYTGSCRACLFSAHAIFMKYIDILSYDLLVK